jgi:hypothetical protein
VLPGLVVAVGRGRPAIEHGAAVLLVSGPGRARLAVDRLELDAALVLELRRAAELGERLVVRSSTSFDDDALWSGSFSSFGDVSVDELPTTVRGCWSSVFCPACIGRFERTGRRPAEVGMAVLIQRLLIPQAGGWAHVDADGCVRIVGRAGEPGPLLAGMDAGVGGSIGADGAIHGELDALPVDGTALRALAHACRAARRTLGFDRVEWAVDGDGPWILQLNRFVALEAPTSAVASTEFNPDTLRSAPFRRLAALLVDRRGPLANALVVPWAAARLSSMDASGPTDPAGDPAELFERAVRDAGALCLAAEAATGLDRGQLVGQLASGDSSVAAVLDRVDLDGRLARRTLDGIASIGTFLTAAGRLPRASAVWLQDEGWIRAALAGYLSVPAAARALDRWDELLFCVVAATGRRLEGVPASSGRAVGRMAWRAAVGDAETDDRPGPTRDGRILAIGDPVANHAPELWDAVGLVAERGGPGAHLCEIARSLHVPAVVGVGLRETPAHLEGCGRDAVVALDGDTGQAWVATLPDPTHGDPLLDVSVADLALRSRSSPRRPAACDQ